MSVITVMNRPGPVRIFDAKGNELCNVVECNTKTGLAIQYVYQNGRPLIAPSGRCVVRTSRFFCPPLRLEPIEK